VRQWPDKARTPLSQNERVEILERLRGLGAAAAKSGDTTLAAIIQHQARKLTGKGHNG
jgi:hypothetical protein